jgi:uncharacterized membrane protein
MEGSDLAVYAILGGIAPFLVSFVKSGALPGWANQLIAVVVCFVAAAVAQPFAGEKSLESLLAYGAVVFGVAQVVYQTYFYGTALNEAMTGALWGPAPTKK